jgi:hypothetical protein
MVVDPASPGERSGKRSGTVGALPSFSREASSPRASSERVTALDSSAPPFDRAAPSRGQISVPGG